MKNCKLEDMIQLRTARMSANAAIRLCLQAPRYTPWVLPADLRIRRGNSLQHINMPAFDELVRSVDELAQQVELMVNNAISTWTSHAGHTIGREAEAIAKVAATSNTISRVTPSYLCVLTEVFCS